MRCSRCQQSNNPGAKYCENCGSKLLKNCPTCGDSDIEGKNFCPKCGTNLKLAFLSMALEDNHQVRELNDLDIESELEIYKRELKDGHIIITCPRCGVKNRMPRSKSRKNPRCGKCGKSLHEMK